MDAVVIGIDGGGTHTRALCADLEGRVLAYAQTGGAHPRKNTIAEENVRAAIGQVLGQAGREPGQVVGLVAGLAGLDAWLLAERLSKDRTWAERCTALPGLQCDRHHVNDAVIAHVGAFCFQAGVIAIAGSGSVIFGVTASGRHIRNYDFQHYANASACALTYDTVFRLLAGEVSDPDAGFIKRIVKALGADDVSDLRVKAACNARRERETIFRQYSDGAPLVTDAARQGVPLARSVCDAMIARLATGIRLVGGMFACESVSYALIGSVVRSAYIQEGLVRTLSQKMGARYSVVEPALSPVAGAVLIALKRQGVTVEDGLIKRLCDHPVVRI
jgi:glucosamine kinase